MRNLYKSLIKRTLDFVVSIVGLIIISPVIIVITVLLFFVNGGKPFFIQSRPGKDERIFKLIKFKTMNDRKDANGNLLPDMDRITGIGAFVRSTSLDELPQLINVLCGDMSLIGPRPLLIQYLPLYNATQKRRHEVRPGITGLAQVNGRNAISWQKKLDYDVWYVDNVSFATDLKIFCTTIIAIINRKGINADAGKTMEPFNGNN